MEGGRNGDVKRGHTGCGSCILTTAFGCTGCGPASVFPHLQLWDRGVAGVGESVCVAAWHGFEDLKFMKTKNFTRTVPFVKRTLLCKKDAFM